MPWPMCGSKYGSAMLLVAFDPVNGYEKELPTNFVPARRGEDQVVIARGMRDLEVEYNIEPLPKASLETRPRANTHGHSGLTRLPLEMQRVLSLILLMPWVRS